MSAGNAARDYLNDLEQARLESPGGFHVPQNGKADNYLQNSQAGNYDENSSHEDRLSEARQRDESRAERSNESEAGDVSNVDGMKNTANTMKEMAQSANQMGAASLLKQINLMGDMPFVAALGAALLKDLLDFVAAPTIVLSILFSAFCSIFIFMMLLLVGSGDKRGIASSLVKKGGALFAGGVADSIPVLNFFPIESLTVAVIYYLTLLERKNSEK